jgi:DNA-binding NarL/FixJ family response regulator
MHTMHSSETLALEAKKAGVRQIVTKGDSGDDLLMAIERVLLETPQPGAAPDAGTQATLDSMTPMIEKSNDVSTPVRDSDATGKSD